ncbi:hypothetical protein JTB14_024943 [Gonioctena quinquepunctata]|nr:hypothetical protein JTB14_024943 [Gonioctena quinquepunctata]
MSPITIAENRRPQYVHSTENFIRTEGLPNPEKTHSLKALDKKVKKALKSCMNPPQRASPELIYVPMKKRGTGVLPMADLVEVASIVQAYKMRTCPESLVHETHRSAT